MAPITVVTTPRLRGIRPTTRVPHGARPYARVIAICEPVSSRRTRRLSATSLIFFARSNHRGAVAFRRDDGDRFDELRERDVRICFRHDLAEARWYTRPSGRRGFVHARMPVQTRIRSDPSRMPPKRLVTIDAARGFAALWVLVFHALVYPELPFRGGLLGNMPPWFAAEQPDVRVAHWSSWAPLWRLTRRLLEPIAIGDLGVPIFFVVSGFCIHMPLARAGRAARVNLANYAKRRFWRLYPTHLTAIVGSIALVTLTHVILRSHGYGDATPISSLALWAHPLMVQAQLPQTAGYTFYFNANLWSLETEIQLYVAYLVLWRVPRRIGWFPFLAALTVISVSFCVMAPLVLPRTFEYSWVAKTFFVGHLLSWYLGAFLAESFYAERAEQNVPQTLILILGALVTVASVLPLQPALPRLRDMLFALGFSGLLWLGLTRERENPSRGFPGREWLTGVGEWSYSLYLWQSPLIRLVLVLAMVFAPSVAHQPLGILIVSAFSAFVAFELSRFAFLLVERHFLLNRSGSVVSKDVTGDPSPAPVSDARGETP
jgi:peptidoglycan/LPS O-acetylase OafA/YrhL